MPETSNPNVGIEKETSCEAEQETTENYGDASPRDIFGDEFETPDINEFLQDVAKRFCPECGTAFPRNHIGRPKEFCCEACRRQWWRRNENPEHWKSTKLLTCPVCGKTFLAVRAEKRNRKYCSRSCANRARGRKEEKEK